MIEKEIVNVWSYHILNVGTKKSTRRKGKRKKVKRVAAISKKKKTRLIALMKTCSLVDLKTKMAVREGAPVPWSI